MFAICFVKHHRILGLFSNSKTLTDKTHAKALSNGANIKSFLHIIYSERRSKHLFQEQQPLKDDQFSIPQASIQKHLQKAML